MCVFKDSKMVHTGRHDWEINGTILPIPAIITEKEHTKPLLIRWISTLSMKKQVRCGFTYIQLKG